LVTQLTPSIHAHTNTDNFARAEFMTNCPVCGSSNIHKDGIRESKTGLQTQKLKCCYCGRKFSESYIRLVRQNENAIYALVQEAKKMGSITETKTVMGEKKTTQKG
jgi:transposase-like protein